MPQIDRHFRPSMRRAMRSFMQSGNFPIPVLHFKFGKNTGDVAYDLSPEGNDGEIQGASWAKGYLGPGLSFDGIDNYVDVPTNLQFGTEPFTVALWYKPLKLLVSADIISKNTTWKDEQWMLWQHSNNKVVFKTYDVTANATVASITVLELGEWIFIVGVRDGATIYIYINGILEGSKDISVDDSFSGTYPLVIGDASRYYSRPVKGVIDEIRMFDVALTPTQILQLKYGIG